jgi:hypothetical protein
MNTATANPQPAVSTQPAPNTLVALRAIRDQEVRVGFYTDLDILGKYATVISLV